MSLRAVNPHFILFIYFFNEKASILLIFPNFQGNMDRDLLDINGLSKSFQKNSVIISREPEKAGKTCFLINIFPDAGVDQSFSVYQHALVSYFSRNSLVWKMLELFKYLIRIFLILKYINSRNNKPFPHRLTFPLKFVSYEDKLCFGPQISPTEITKIAFLHVFNINVTSADDYRANVRHNVSDWFAKVIFDFFLKDFKGGVALFSVEIAIMIIKFKKIF